MTIRAFASTSPQTKKNGGSSAQLQEKSSAPAGEKRSSPAHGTDCSGIDSPIIALELLGRPYTHVFSSEIDSCAVSKLIDPNIKRALKTCY